MIATIAQAVISLTQSIELSILAKATVMLALGLASARLAVRARASLRHLLLTVTFAAVMALPIAAIAVPGVVIQVPVADAKPRPAVPSASRLKERSPMPARAGKRPERSRSVELFATLWPEAVRWGWLAGVAALCLSVGLSLGRLRRIRRDGLPWPELQELVQSLAT